MLSRGLAPSVVMAMSMAYFFTDEIRAIHFGSIVYVYGGHAV
jgi:hypothetical protein